MPETFSFTPNYTYAVDDEWKTAVTPMENGTERRTSRRNNEIKEWDLDFRTLTSAQFTSMRAFFNARKGKYEAFYWTCKLDSIQYLVRFNADKISHRKVQNDRYTVRLRLREVTA